MSDWIKTVFSLAMFLLPAVAVSASEYFVSPSGNAANDGSESSPWPSIGFALNRAVGGDVITLLPGTYPEAVVIEISGSEERPTVLRSQRKWEAIIQDSPSHGIYMAGGVRNVLIDGLQVSRAAIDGLKVGSQTIIRNCWVHHSAGQGITAHQTRDVIIEQSLIELNGTDPVFDHGIYLSGTNDLVRSCVIRWNKCYGCQFYADAPASSALCQFYNNLVYGNRNALAVWSGDGQTNWVFNNSLSASRHVLRADGGTLCVSNNILLGPNARRIFSAEHGAEFQSDYNAISSSGRRRGSHDVLVADPGFINSSNGLFWLSADSRARGVAAPGLLPPVDFFGREQHTMQDIGAFQYSADLATDGRVLDPSPAKPDYWLTNVQNNH